MRIFGRNKHSGEDSGPPRWPERFTRRAQQARHPALKAFYERGTASGDTPLSTVPFAALDLETTGLNPARHAIVSIGLVPFTLARIRCREAYYRVVRPRRPLVRKSVTIHHITHEELAGAPDLEAVVDELLAAMSGRVMVVHYRAIERRFLDGALRERLGEGLEFPVIDTMELEARIHRSRWSALRLLAGGRRTSLRLADSRRRYHLPGYTPHHALTDALATAELLQAQVAHRFDPDTPLADLWC